MKIYIKTIYSGTADVTEYIITAQSFFKYYGIEIVFSETPKWHHVDLTIREDVAGGSTNIKTKYDGAYKVRIGLLQDYLPNGKKIWRDVGQILIHEILHCLWAEMGMGDIHDKNLGVRDNIRVMEIAKATNHPDKIILHHSGNQADTYESIKAYHISKGWGDVAYHFVITRESEILVGRWEIREGAHTPGENHRSIGICLVGNFSENLPSKEQISSLKKVFNEYDQLKSFPHREFSKTECYGKNLADTWSEDIRNKKTMKLKLIREKGRKEVYWVLNGKPRWIGGIDTFNDLVSDGLVKWEDIEEVDEIIENRGILM